MPNEQPDELTKLLQNLYVDNPQATLDSGALEQLISQDALNETGLDRSTYGMPPAPKARPMPPRMSPQGPAPRLRGPLPQQGALGTSWGGFRPDDVIEALTMTESSGNPNAVSPKGAIGLMQLMPPTAIEVAEKIGLQGFHPRMLRNPEINRLLGIEYLRQQIAKFGDLDLGLAAYNGGPTRVQGLLDKHGANSFEGIVEHLPAETQNYVKVIRERLRARRRAPGT